ncbi:MAG TPA: sulfotransferase [Thermomonas sp.]|nr:sulfotransferase [Thermomonas sp.]
MTTAPEPRIRFLLGGVQKAGTSALARYLGMHPRLRLPIDKEAHVFDAPDFDDGWTSARVDALYAAHFGTDQQDQAALHGDATPFYLVHPRVLERIARYNPGMRWIVLLRDPVERALSQFHMERQRGKDGWPLWPALLLESWRLRGHADDFSRNSPLRRHGYRLRSDYARQLDALYARFPRDQVLLLRNRELRDDPNAAVRKACEFLGVEPMPGELQRERVFAGDYAPLPRDGLRMRALRWIMRRELRDMQARHGIVFDD